MKAGTKKFSLKLVLMCGLLVISMFVFYRIAAEAVFERETVLDDFFINIRDRYSTPALVNFMKWITFFGSSNFLLPAYLVLTVAFLIQRKYSYAIATGVIAILATALMFILKRIFHRDRPQDPLIERLTNYSFPSGHAFSSFIFCSILGYIVWRSDLQALWKWILMIGLLIFSITIGLSRIILNVHYATDVIAGFCLGVMWVMLFFWTFKRFAS